MHLAEMEGTVLQIDDKSFSSAANPASSVLCDKSLVRAREFHEAYDFESLQFLFCFIEGLSLLMISAS